MQKQDLGGIKEIFQAVINQLRDKYSQELEQIEQRYKKQPDTDITYRIDPNQIKFLKIDIYYIKVLAGKRCPYCEAMLQSDDYLWLKGQILKDLRLDSRFYDFIEHECDWTDRYASSELYPNLYTDRFSEAGLEYYHARGRFTIVRFPVMEIELTQNALDKKGTNITRHEVFRALGEKSEYIDPATNKKSMALRFSIKDQVLSFIEGDPRKIRKMSATRVHAKSTDYAGNDPQIFNKESWN